MKIVTMCIFLSVNALYCVEQYNRLGQRGAEGQMLAKQGQRQRSSLRNARNAEQFLVRQPIANTQEEDVEACLKMSVAQNERQILIAALTKVNYDFSQGMPSAQMVVDDSFWLRLHCAEHRRKVAESEAQKLLTEEKHGEDFHTADGEI